jgi:hypothetical protein
LEVRRPRRHKHASSVPATTAKGDQHPAYAAPRPAWSAACGRSCRHTGRAGPLSARTDGHCTAIRLRFQHRVQRLLDRSSHHPTQVLTHSVIIDPDHVPQRASLLSSSMGALVFLAFVGCLRKHLLSQSGGHRRMCEDSLRHQFLYSRDCLK